MIKSLTALAMTIQDAFEDEDRMDDLDDAIADVNRLLHDDTIDPDVAALATALLELAIVIED